MSEKHEFHPTGNPGKDPVRWVIFCPGGRLVTVRLSPLFSVVEWRRTVEPGGDSNRKEPQDKGGEGRRGEKEPGRRPTLLLRGTWFPGDSDG